MYRRWTRGGNNIDNNNNNNNNNGVLVARGGRERSNPAKTTTHSGTVEKETHFINVVGKCQGTISKMGGAKIVVYLK